MSSYRKSKTHLLKDGNYCCFTKDIYKIADSTYDHFIVTCKYCQKSDHYKHLFDIANRNLVGIETSTGKWIVPANKIEEFNDLKV